jgi:putative transposase
MSLFQNKYRVESIRLHGYDYSQNGMYFVTVCTNDRVYLFGRIDNRKMVLNRYGTIVVQCWNDLPNHYPNIILDEFVVMSNHIHGIIIIDNNLNTSSKVETGLKPVSTEITQIPDITNGHNPPKNHQNRHGLSEIVRALKTFSSRQINELRHTQGINIWQPGYYDHIIHSQNEYKRIKMYIRNNPNNT